MRARFVTAHRWVGLAMALFLLIAGLTGSLLAWNTELDALFNPALRAGPPAATAGLMDPLIIRDQLAQRYPQVRFDAVDLANGAGALTFDAFPPAGVQGGPVLDFDQVFASRHTGEVTGTRMWGDITQGMKNLMPFIFRLHYSLALGDTGKLLFGIVALLWALDCFVGGYLSLPAPNRDTQKQPTGPARKPWLPRWWPAWQVRWKGSGYKVVFDLHRAGGLWLWAALLVMAWAAVSFNLPQVYKPVMNAVFAHQSAEENLPDLPKPQLAPGIPWQAARAIGRVHMAEQASRHGFRVFGESSLRYDSTRATYRYEVLSNLDASDRQGSTAVTFDANTGALLLAWRPTGAAAGDTLRSWLSGFHMATLWGLPFKLLISLMGIAVSALTISGVIIYAKKWRARRFSARKRAGLPMQTCSG